MLMDPETMMLMVEERSRELRRTMERSRARPLRFGASMLWRGARALAAGLRSARLRASSRAVS